jgi:hypothetical protein
VNYLIALHFRFLFSWVYLPQGVKAFFLIFYREMVATYCKFWQKYLIFIVNCFNFWIIAVSRCLKRPSTISLRYSLLQWREYRTGVRHAFSQLKAFTFSNELSWSFDLLEVLDTDIPSLFRFGANSKWITNEILLQKHLVMKIIFHSSSFQCRCW